MFWTWLRNVLRATTACIFSTSEPPKVVRIPSVLNILTSKYASRHNGMHFFDIWTSKRGPNLSISAFHLSILSEVWLLNFLRPLHNYTPLHYITLHYATFHYTSLHYTTLHSTTLQIQLHNYTPLHSTTLNYSTLHYITLHYITLHYTPLHYTPQHYNYNYTTTLHYTPVH